MYKAGIGGKQFEVEPGRGEVLVNGKAVPLQIQSRSDGGYDVLWNGEASIADIVKLDLEQKTLVLRIKSKKYTVHIKEPVDLLVERLGIKSSFHKKVNNLKAPMPGLVSRILVEEGQFVKLGDPLLVLEAMKMENIFKAGSDVQIKSIRVKEKQAVEKGEELIAFD